MTHKLGIYPIYGIRFTKWLTIPAIATLWLVKSALVGICHAFGIPKRNKIQISDYNGLLKIMHTSKVCETAILVGFLQCCEGQHVLKQMLDVQPESLPHLVRNKKDDRVTVNMFKCM